MFWRMAGLSTVSPVEAILDKDNFSLEELLDDDEIIQECKALNGRLINFLRERAQMEQLLRYIVDEASEDAEKRRTFKLPFISCEIFTCEVDIILKTLVEDEEASCHIPDVAEDSSFYELCSKCGGLEKAQTFVNGIVEDYGKEFGELFVALWRGKGFYGEGVLWNGGAKDDLELTLSAHQQIVRQLVDLIGITSIMEVLIRLIGAEEHMYSNYLDAMQWLEETDVLEMILDKFGSSDLPEVHANAAETLCAITRYVPPGLASVISSPSFVGRIFSQALEDSRPKSVLVHSLSVCISLLDPKRLTSGPYHVYRGQVTQVPLITANPEIVGGMLESIVVQDT
ncbi:hypothetical protein GIB67_023802 [Kingdonia uniflora]|uniref:SIT4 phosphatase-associated family protein n=1 Tax=Kingdonia uniflora TaxID=39325 RepID=A0A7J7NGI1_9MAGN|nr:hypothetical protein GIB67_023802 [Kingdonia uniflora]